MHAAISKGIRLASIARMAGCLRLLRELEAFGELLTIGRTDEEPLLPKGKRRKGGRAK